VLRTTDVEKGSTEHRASRIEDEMKVGAAKRGYRAREGLRLSGIRRFLEKDAIRETVWVPVKEGFQSEVPKERQPVHSRELVTIKKEEHGKVTFKSPREKLYRRKMGRVVQGEKGRRRENEENHFGMSNGLRQFPTRKTF